MNGPHDVGGDQGFGRLPLEPDEPLFHGEWERRVLALTLAMGATGQWNLDMTRSVREALPPATYLSSSYYEIWFEALLILLERQALLTAAECRALERGEVAALAAIEAGPAPALPVLRPERVAAALAAGSPTARSGPPSRYRVGDRVRVRLMNPAGHTRAPRYVRGRPGIVSIVHGPHVLPDHNFRGQGETAEPLYTVRFAARDLWGSDTTADAVSADCWESYLEDDAAGPINSSGASRSEAAGPPVTGPQVIGPQATAPQATAPQAGSLQAGSALAADTSMQGR